MPTTDQLQFEMQRRVILFNSGTTMPDNTVLGYEGNPNSANTSTPGQTLLYNSPRGTSYIELVNGNLWYKQQIPNTWINLTSGTQSGTANFSSQNNVVYTTGDQNISGVKNFYSRPTVNGSGVLLIGETGSVVLPNTLVYTTGDQTINGLKDFTTRPTVNTIPVLLSGEVNTTISGILYSAQINIKNNNGSTIYKGQPVYVSSAAGTNILVKLASNSGEQTSSKTLGLVYQTSLAQNAQGTIVTEGLLQDFNTNAGEEGDPIWLGPTGSLIFGLANKPYAPNHLVYLGVLTRKHANQGEVFVKIQNGFELEELHNVNINHRNALADKNIIRYDSLSGIWFNDTIDSVLPNSIVYITGNQTISGNKTFDVAPVISGNKLITGLDLSSYATSTNLYATGSTLDNKINSLSGYVNAQSTSGQVFNTGSVLDNKINTLSGYVNSQDNIFSGQTFNTGSRLDSKINSLSGYVDAKSIVLPTTIVYTTGNQTISGTKTFVENTVFGDPSQGDFLVISGNTFSIYGSGNFTSGLFVNGNPVLTGIDLSSYATNANLFTTGSTLDNKINSLSGYVSGISLGGLLPSTIVYTTGNQLISGNKTFLNNIAVSGTGNFNNVRVSSIDKLFLSGIDMVVTGNSSINVYNNIYISGNQVLTGVDLSSYATNINLYTTGSILDNKINSLSGYVNSQSASGQVFNTGSLLDNKINTLSGYVNSQDIIFSGQTFNTGSRLDNKINSLSGYVNSQDVIFSGQTASTGSILDNKINALSGYVSGISAGGLLPNSIVYTTGNQIISGNKTFLNNVIISGTGIFDALDLNNIDTLSLSGVDISLTNGNVSLTNRPTVNGTGVVLSGELNPIIVNTGSLLNNKINSLSGYVNSQDIVFSGQTFNTGSRLDNKINSLSGYVDSKAITLPSTIVYTTGNQIISGNKNFVENVTFGDQTQDDLLIISGNEISFGVYPTINGTGIVYTQGDQTISGIKTFTSRPTVNGTGVLLIGEASAITLPTTIVYTTGNQLISGNKTFLNNIAVSGTGDFNSVKVSSIDKLFLSGIDIVITGNSSINVYNAIYISGNPVLTGSVQLGSYATVSNLFSTGSILDNKINSLSGYVNSQDIIFSGQTASTGSRLDSKINSLSGYVDSKSITLPSTIVYTTGNQTISGNKTFLNNLQVSGTGIFQDINIINLNELVISGAKIIIGGDSGVYSSSNIYISGNQVLTGVDLSSYATIANLFATGSTLDNKINSLSGYVNAQDIVFSGQTFNTGSRLDNKINALSGYVTGITGTFGTLPANLALTGSILNDKINYLSGYVNSQDIVFSGQAALTGSTLNNKINRLSGYVDSKSITLPSTIVYTTGNQTISGNKNFAENVIVGDQTQDNLLVISGNTISFGVYPTINGTGIVYTQGNQTISGIKTFDVLPIVSGNRLITGVDLNPYATNANLFTTGSILDNKINSLSGYVNSQSTSGQVFSTGSRLDNKINSLSGYVNTQDIIFSGQTFNTGSRLDNKINALSGYISGISAGGTLPSSIVYITGNQTISGVKTFANTGSFNTVQITNKKLSSYNYVNSNFTFGDIYINIVNSSNNVIGTLPSSVTSGINYYVKNLNTGVLLITGSGQRTIDGFSNINLYKNESLQLLGVNNVGYTGWVTLSADNGVS